MVPGSTASAEVETADVRCRMSEVRWRIGRADRLLLREFITKEVISTDATVSYDSTFL